MATRKVMLKYPEGLIKEPLVGKMVKQFDVMPNIRRARVTETIGEIALELEGADEDLDRAIAWLKEAGVDVQPLAGDVVE